MPQHEHAAPRARAARAPGVLAPAVHSRCLRYRISWQRGIVADLEPGGGQPALISQDELLLKPVTDLRPAVAHEPFEAEIALEGSSPNVADKPEPGECGQQALPDRG